MAKRVSTTSPPPTRLPIPAEVAPVRQEPPTQNCGNCSCFLSTDPSTGKGRCRFFPPVPVHERETPNTSDAEGRRWPVCWESEWCKQWSSK